MSLKNFRLHNLKSLFASDSLRVQLLARSLLILAVLLVLVGLLQYVFMRDIIYRNKAVSMQSQIMPMSPVIWEGIDKDSVNEGMRPPRFFNPETDLAFIDFNGDYTVLSSKPDGPAPPRLSAQEYLSALNKHPRPDYKVINAGGVEQLVVLQPVGRGPGEQIGIVQASTLTAPLKELLLRQLFTFLILSLIAMLFGLLAFLPAIKKALRPLSNMVDTSEQIDAGNLDKRFPTGQGQVEIDSLAESFNGMLERLEASFKAEKEIQEQMRRFVADASHELRTPLTSIHGFLEVLLRGAANQPEQLAKALKSMHSESERLNKLVQNLLLLAKLDRTPNIELKEGYLDSAIREMEPQLRILAGDRSLSLQLESELKCKYDEDKIKQLVLNLFHNSVQHTDPKAGYIQILLYRKGNGVQIAVQDNGPGISPEHLPHIFERFYRSDSSRTRKYGGAGLGLSIAKSIVEAHGGIITVESEAGEGCSFQVWLPQ